MAVEGGSARPWWWGPGPMAFGLFILAAAGAVGWQGYAAAHKPVDPAERDRQTLRGSGFCDTPTPAGSTAAPPVAPAPPRPTGRR